LLVDKYPKSNVDVFVLVLECDGPVLGAAITAASLAMSDAGLELRDVVAACRCVVVVFAILMLQLF
jgi:ribonuclease PH